MNHESPYSFLYKAGQDLMLLAGPNPLWRFHIATDHRKPYFHPVHTTSGIQLTCFEPWDDIWHRGLWFSWHTINGVNYWEESEDGIEDHHACDYACIHVVPAEQRHGRRADQQVDQRIVHLPDQQHRRMNAFAGFQGVGSLLREALLRVGNLQSVGRCAQPPERLVFRYRMPRRDRLLLSHSQSSDGDLVVYP